MLDKRDELGLTWITNDKFENLAKKKNTVLGYVFLLNQSPANAKKANLDEIRRHLK